MTRLAFDEESTRRIAATVRRVEQMPRTDGRGGMTAVTPIPFLIRQFQLKTTWEWNSEQFAIAYRMYWNGSEMVTDEYHEYTIYTPIVEAVDLHFNLVSSPSEPMEVIAYHRHDVDRWEVIHMSQNLTRTAKVQSDWEVPTGPAIHPKVSVKIINDDSGLEITGEFDVNIPIVWDASNQTKPAPELFTGDYCQINITPFGHVFVTGPIAFSFLGQIIDYTGSSVDIPDGYVLADGAVLPGDKKVPVSNAPDLRGRMTIGIDPADSAGDGSENAIGDIGGERWHGESGNNHPDHDNHRHALDMDTVIKNDADEITTWNPGTGDATLIYTSREFMRTGGTNFTSGVAAESGGGGTNMLNHLGPINNSGNFDTDNRSKYYVVAKIYRYK